MRAEYPNQLDYRGFCAGYAAALMLILACYNFCAGALLNTPCVLAEKIVGRWRAVHACAVLRFALPQCSSMRLLWRKVIYGPHVGLSRGGP